MVSRICIDLRPRKVTVGRDRLDIHKCRPQLFGRFAFRIDSKLHFDRNIKHAVVINSPTSRAMKLVTPLDFFRAAVGIKNHVMSFALRSLPLPSTDQFSGICSRFANLFGLCSVALSRL